MPYNNRAAATQIKEKLNQFKIKSAAEVGIHLKDGYNGNLTAKEAGSIGGNMVKKMIQAYKQELL
ncbi:alpha/beta-type small acid-soluble spore protein [Clostridium sp. LBM24168]